MIQPLCLALGSLLLEDYSPSICLNIMSSYSAWGPICHFFKGQFELAPIMMSQTQFDIKSMNLTFDVSFVTKEHAKGFLKKCSRELLS